MSDFAVKVTVRNARLLRRIRAQYGTAAAMARKTGLRSTDISALLTMRRTPLAHDDWSPLAFDVSSALHCEPEDLWPSHIARIKLRKNEQEIEMSLPQIEGLIGAGEQVMANTMLRHWIGAAKLTDREREVIARRVAGEALEDCVTVLDVTRERVRQIEAKAMRKIRGAAKRRGIECIQDAVTA